jgi:alpha,alpha-trehalase
VICGSSCVETRCLIALCLPRRSRNKPQLNLDVEVLPPKPDDPMFVKSVNERPGILALAMKKKKLPNGKTTFEGIPFIVPGARFNEVRDLL